MDDRQIEKIEGEGTAVSSLSELRHAPTKRREISTRQKEEELMVKMFGPGPDKEEKMVEFFDKVADGYEATNPVDDSIVRLDQEEALLESLRAKVPILVRGYYHVGKTSMAKTIVRRHYQNDVYLTGTGEIKAPFEEFKKTFGIRQVRQYILERERPEIMDEQIRQAEREIEKRIDESDLSPLGYLDRYLGQRGEQALLVLDEVMHIVGTRDREKLNYLASLRELANLDLIIILHRSAEDEELLGETFAGFETYYPRALTFEEVNLLVHRPLEGTPIRFTPGAIREVLAFTGGAIRDPMFL